MRPNTVRTAADTVNLWARLLRLCLPIRRTLPQLAPDKRQHLALLAWALPPSTSAGVHRPLSWLRYGDEHGWQISAFRGPVRKNQGLHGDELLSHVHASVKMHTVDPPSQAPSHRLFPRVDGGFKNAIASAESAIKALRESPPSIVLASGPPFCTFVAARLVAGYFDVPYVLDYRDEWTECPFEFVSKDGNDRWWERWCLARASRVVFTTESHRRHQLAQFPLLDEARTALVPNGWEPGDFVSTKEKSEPQKDTLLLSHVGTLSEHTPIEPLLNLLHRVHDLPSVAPGGLRVRLVGQRSASIDAVISRHEARRCLEFVGPVGKRQANCEMSASSVLLLIAAHGLERYLPGKLFDYIAAKRPILVLGTRGEASDLVERLGIGIRCADDSAEAFASALASLQRIDVDAIAADIDVWLARHERRVLAGQLFQLLSQSCAGRA